MTFFQANLALAIWLIVIIFIIIIVVIIVIAKFIGKKMVKTRAGTICLASLLLCLGFFLLWLSTTPVGRGSFLLVPILFIILGFVGIFKASFSKEKGVVNQDNAIPSTIETSTQQRFCNSCGSPLSESDSQFCTNCGSKIE